MFSSVQPSTLLLLIQFICSPGPWHQKASEFLKNQRKRPWFNRNILDKGAPLLLFLFVCGESRRERIGQLGRNRGFAPCESRGDRLRKPVIIESE